MEDCAQKMSWGVNVDEDSLDYFDPLITTQVNFI
jgi:hypothetical protein